MNIFDQNSAVYINVIIHYRLKKVYDQDAEKHNGVPSIKRTVFRFIRTRMIASSFAACLSVLSALIGPVCFNFIATQTMISTA